MATRPAPKKPRVWGFRELATDLERRLPEFGDYLPSLPELRAEYDVGYQTARRATEVLAERGLVAINRGRRTQIIAQGGWNLPEAIAKVSEAMQSLDVAREYLIQLANQQADQEAEFLTPVE